MNKVHRNIQIVQKDVAEQRMVLSLEQRNYVKAISNDPCETVALYFWYDGGGAVGGGAYTWPLTISGWSAGGAPDGGG